MNSQIFSNKYNIYDRNFQELAAKCLKYKNEIDDYELLKQINYQLGRDYYIKAKTWLVLFRNAEWWREDLK
jgi:hypothetical protein